MCVSIFLISELGPYLESLAHGKQLDGSDW